MEFRQRFLNTPSMKAGVVVFYDGARIADTAEGPSQTLHDVGVGLRLSLKGSSVVRLDYGYGLTDGKNAFTVGFGEVF